MSSASISFLIRFVIFLCFSAFIELVASSESENSSSGEDNEFMEMQNVIALSLQETQ